MQTLTGSDTFILPSYVLSHIPLTFSGGKIKKLNKRTFRWLLLYTLIYYYSEINKEEGKVFVKFEKIKDCCYKTCGMKEPFRDIENISENDPYIINPSIAEGKLTYSVSPDAFNGEYIKIPLSFIRKRFINRITRPKYYSNAAGLFFFYKLMEISQKNEKSRDNLNKAVITSDNIKALINAFVPKLKQELSGYINHFRQINLIIEKDKGEFYLNFKNLKRINYTIPSHIYRDRLAFKTASRLVKLLHYIDISKDFDSLYDLIVRLKTNLFHFNKRGRFYLNLTDQSVDIMSSKDLKRLKNKSVSKMFKETVKDGFRLDMSRIDEVIDYPEGISCSKAELKYKLKELNPHLSKNKINSMVKKYSEKIEDICTAGDFIYRDKVTFRNLDCDYRALRISEDLALHKIDTSFTDKFCSILNSSPVRTIIISSSDGGYKIKFDKDIEEKDKNFFQSLGCKCNKRRLIIPPDDIFYLMKMFLNRFESYNEEYIRDYKTSFFNKLSYELEHISSVNYNGRAPFKITPKDRHKKIILKRFKWQKDSYKASFPVDGEIKDFIALCHKDFYNGKEEKKNIKLLDFYCTVRIKTEENIIPDGSEINIKLTEFDRKGNLLRKNIIKDIQKEKGRFQKPATFKYKKDMPFIKREKASCFSDYAGWILLKKDIIKENTSFAIDIAVNTEKISNRETMDLNIIFDFSVNYLFIKPAGKSYERNFREQFNDYWEEDYLQAIKINEEDFNNW